MKKERLFGSVNQTKVTRFFSHTLPGSQQITVTWCGYQFGLNLNVT